MRDYVTAQTDSLTRAGQDVPELLQKIQETPEANGILSTFAQLATQGESS